MSYMRRGFYTTQEDAIQHEIIGPIGHTWVDFAINEIADKAIALTDDGYTCIVDVDEFWEIVEENRF